MSWTLADLSTAGVGTRVRHVAFNSYVGAITTTWAAGGKSYPVVKWDSGQVVNELPQNLIAETPAAPPTAGAYIETPDGRIIQRQTTIRIAATVVNGTGSPATVRILWSLASGTTGLTGGHSKQSTLAPRARAAITINEIIGGVRGWPPGILIAQATLLVLSADGWVNVRTVTSEKLGEVRRA